MISSNAAKLAAAWKQRSKALAPVMRDATHKATQVTYEESRKQMRELIYNKPVPTVNGKKLWHRTGNLRRSERMRFAGDYTGIIENAASTGDNYYQSARQQEQARRVARAAKSGRKARDLKPPKPTAYAAARHDNKHCRYPAPWRDRAVKATAERRRQIFRDAMLKAIRAGIAPGI